jgi:YqaJ-like viral recombinase domain
MAVNKIADAKADKEHWLSVRREYLSSSEVFSWRGVFDKETDWWPERREDVLAYKRGEREKLFDPESETSVWHGTYDEPNILHKFAHAAGFIGETENGFYVNDRWPALGASIDGWGTPGAPDTPFFPEACQDRRRIVKVREAIAEHGGEFLVEIKKSTSTKWQTKVPDYYQTQVQTQLAILECPLAIIVAETFCRGKKEKWRTYWDMQPYIIRPKAHWLGVMDRLNEEACREIRGVL